MELGGELDGQSPQVVTLTQRSTLQGPRSPQEAAGWALGMQSRPCPKMLTDQAECCTTGDGPKNQELGVVGAWGESSWPGLGSGKE